jgi:uncharacterized protein YciI
MDGHAHRHKAAAVNFLLICRPVPGIDAATAFRPHLVDEMEALRSLRDQGILVSAYTPDGPGAFLIIDVASASDAEGVAGQLPLTAAGLLDVEVVPLRPIPGL